EQQQPHEIRQFELLVPCRLQGHRATSDHLGTEVDHLPVILEETEQLQELPTGYIDVCEGRFADWKRTIKRKLLHQFQTSYVDVLSRQQSAFNRQVLALLHHLTERLVTLEQRLVQIEEHVDETLVLDR